MDKLLLSSSSFEFGKNWLRFLNEIDEERVELAKSSLCSSLGMKTLHGKRFADVGCGSGLFSLAAAELGAKVVSLDVDYDSVRCTAELRRKLSPSHDWQVEQGSALDETYLETLGQFDIVYSWGVLHHTGDMWRAMANVSGLVITGGYLYIALYNDLGWGSQAWRQVKRLYNLLPSPLRPLVLLPSFLRLWGPKLAIDALALRPFRRWRAYKTKSRGMSPWRDVVDWVGGYPFEVARPDHVFDFYHERGFDLHRFVMNRGQGCNEFVFQRRAGA